MTTLTQTEDPETILKARIALLATAIGGPDYTSKIVPPPYKLGDDCLACLKDLKRWFKLVDDQQNRWDVAMAAAEYKILIDDLVPILIDWENKCTLATKLSRKKRKEKQDSPEVPTSETFRNKAYHDRVALHCLQLLVLMTWPLVLTDQSTANQVNLFTELKKHQLVYKKTILSMENGKVLKAVVRIAADVMKIERLRRTPRDNIIIKLVLNFFRNIIAIEPGALMITSKKTIPKGINSVDTLPPNVSLDDISTNTVVNTFQKNKVFPLLLTLSSTLNTEFDQDFINMPLVEVLFYLSKDINQNSLFNNNNDKGGMNGKEFTTETGSELTDLLKKEFQMKKNLIKNTSSRHSRFGTLISIQTHDNGRLTVSGSRNALNDSAALNKLDSNKKWSKPIRRAKDDPLEEGLPNSLFNERENISVLHGSTRNDFKNFINNFIDSGFNILLKSVTNYCATEQDKLVTIEQIEYLLFFSWFVKYQIVRCNNEKSAHLTTVSEALSETSFILVSHFLRASYELRNWVVVHASMVAFNDLLLLLNKERKTDADLDDIDFIMSRLFSDDRIQLLANLPKTAMKHTPQYISTCVDLTHTVLKTLEQYSTEDNKLIVGGRRRTKKKPNITTEDIEKLMEDDQLDRDEAIDMLTSQNRQIEVNFQKVQSSFINDPTIDTYINYLQRFRELNQDRIKKVIAFFHRVFIQAKEEAFLFRIDLIMLLRDILSDTGLERNARVRKHVEQFSSYYLGRLKKKVKESPAWYVGILFPLLHDSEVGYFQRYGENRSARKRSFYGAPPSRFKRIEDEEMLSPTILNDIRYGILVSTLLDDNKLEILEELVKYLEKTLDIFKSWLTLNIENETETRNPPNEFFKMGNNLGNPILLDKDYRALLKMLGFIIPSNESESCYLPGETEISTLQNALESVKKYISTPFETPNGLASSTYLIRPRTSHADIVTNEADGWTGQDDYDYDDPSIVRDDSNDDNDYFKALDNDMDERLKDRNISKGFAKAKNKNLKSKKTRKANNLPMFDIDDEEISQKKDKISQVVSSKAYISDSEDEDDMNPIFFENERYMRWLLDKYNGQMSKEQHILFGKFSSERLANGGLVRNDYTALFNGPVPKLSDVEKGDNSSQLPDRALLSLNSKLINEGEVSTGYQMKPQSNQQYNSFHEMRETESDLLEGSSDPSTATSQNESEDILHMNSKRKASEISNIDSSIHDNSSSDFDSDEDSIPRKHKKRATFLNSADDE